MDGIGWLCSRPFGVSSCSKVVEDWILAGWKDCLRFSHCSRDIINEMHCTIRSNILNNGNGSPGITYRVWTIELARYELTIPSVCLKNCFFGAPIDDLSRVVECMCCANGVDEP